MKQKRKARHEASTNGTFLLYRAHKPQILLCSVVPHQLTSMTLDFFPMTDLSTVNLRTIQPYAERLSPFIQLLGCRYSSPSHYLSTMVTRPNMIAASTLLASLVGALSSLVAGLAISETDHDLGLPNGHQRRQSDHIQVFCRNETNVPIFTCVLGPIPTSSQDYTQRSE